MFRGRYEHALDSKGRISIPSKFREILAKKYDDRLVITNFDHCLLAFPYKEWSVVDKKVGSFSLVRKETSAFFRFFSSSLDIFICTSPRATFFKGRPPRSALRNLRLHPGRRRALWNRGLMDRPKHAGLTLRRSETQPAAMPSHSRIRA